jgi:glycosyltransferase involved in cell wall biosynthesis
VQRGLKLVKYIGDHGWEPVVITPDRPSVPVLDPGLARELPPGLVVERLTSWEPRLGEGVAGSGTSPSPARGAKALLKELAANLLFPDRHLLWLPTALPGLVRAVRRWRPEAVMVSAPPFSSFLLGWAASRLFGLPLLLDFRDEWSGFYARGFHPGGQGRLWGAAVNSLEGMLVRAAVTVTCASPDYASRFRQLYGGLPDKYLWIPNGYDPADFPAAPTEPPSAPLLPPLPPLRLVYTGTVMGVTSLRPLWRALALLSEEQRRRIVIEVAGRVVDDEPVDPGLAGLRVEVHGYLDHQAALARMRAAHALVLTLSPGPGAERVIPGKLYEYLAARRPILGLLPRGRASALLEACAAGTLADPGQPAQAAEAIAAWLEQPPAPLPPPPRLFDRRQAAAAFASALDRAVEGRP